LAYGKSSKVCRKMPQRVTLPSINDGGIDAPNGAIFEVLLLSTSSSF